MFLDVNSKIIWYISFIYQHIISGPFFRDSINDMIISCLCETIKNHQRRLKEVILFFKTHKGKLDIDVNHYFIHQFLEDQTNLHLLYWVYKVICLTLGPIIFCLHQLPCLNEAPWIHPHQYKLAENQLQRQLIYLELHVYLI